MSKSLVAVGLGLAGVAAVALAAVTLAGEEPPYEDPAATGLLTLCDSNGKARTEGKTDEPLADVVIGSTAAAGQYRTRGAVASLFAYQPREGVDPAEFSGLQLTGSSVFGKPSRPAVRVTKASTTLGDFTVAFPAQLDDYVQLRLLISAPHAGTQTNRYDTADVRVKGNRWRIVRGGTANCSDAASAIADPSNS